MNPAPEKNSKERLIKTVGMNIAYGYLTMAWSIALGFWATPLVLRFLGNEQYGLWGIILSLFGTVTFLDIGLGSALVLFVADRRVRENAAEVHATINSALTLYLFFGLLGGLFLIFGGRGFLTPLLKISPEFQRLVHSLFSLYGLLFIIQMPVKVYEDVLIGLQRLDLTNKTGLAIRTLERLLVILLLMKGVPFLNVAAISGAIGVCLYITEFFFVRRLLPGYRVNFKLRRRDLIAFLTTGIQQFIAGFGSILVGVIDRFLLGTLLHVRFVTFYELASRPAQLIYQVSLRFFLPIYPASTELHAHEKNRELHALFKKGTKLVVVLSIVLTWVLFFWAPALIAFWVGPGYDLSASMLRILSINYFLLSLNLVPAAVMYGLNKAWVLSWEGLIRIVLNAVFSFLFITRFGAVGASYGLTLASLMTTLVFFVWMAREVGVGVQELFLEVLLFPIAMGLLGVLFLQGPIPLAEPWRFALFLALFCFTAFFFYLGKQEATMLVKTLFGRNT